MKRRLRRRYGRALTRWSDAMILDSIERHHMMTPQAMDRAYTLVERGYIDASGTWKLTPRGRRALERSRRSGAHERGRRIAR